MEIESGPQLIFVVKPGIVNEDRCHPRPSVFLSLPTTNDVRGNIIGTLGKKLFAHTKAQIIRSCLMAQVSPDLVRWTLDATCEPILWRSILSISASPVLPSQGLGLITHSQKVEYGCFSSKYFNTSMSSNIHSETCPKLMLMLTLTMLMSRSILESFLWSATMCLLLYLLTSLPGAGRHLSKAVEGHFSTSECKESEYLPLFCS